MRKNKAFTLIELLAVIIILAIIALIATPIVLNVVEESKETARRSSISGYADGVRYAVYSDDYIYTGKYSEVTKEWAEANVEVSGDKVDCEEVRFSDGFETVLHKCRVGKSTKEYCYASGKTYEDCENEEYKSIYQSFFLKDLAQELIKQYNESNTAGLLKDTDGSYYYRGTKEEVNNNFVWFAGHLWRVISIDNDNNITMITQQPLTSIQSADADWITEQEYKKSSISNQWINEVFLGSMEESDKVKIQDNIFNIGGGYNSDTEVVENIDSIITRQKAGLLDDNQYNKAGLKDSYLDIKDGFWLGNQYDGTRLRFVNSAGSLTSNTFSRMNGVRPVIKISSFMIVGKGNLDNPYREISTTKDISQVKVGEYISVSTSGNDCGEDKICLFRVVSKNSDSIKVIFNGLLPNVSAFDANGNSAYTSGNTVDNQVKAFAETINSKYRYQEAVGLPVVGEMFSGNDIDISISSTKSFVNINIIENPIVSNKFWTMDKFTSSKVHIVASSGSLSSDDVTNEIGVRPVLFLNNNLTFISGEGTAENPFMLN